MPDHGARLALLVLRALLVNLVLLVKREPRVILACLVHLVRLVQEDRWVRLAYQDLWDRGGPLGFRVPQEILVQSEKLELRD